jgi:hypothetical protein
LSRRVPRVLTTMAVALALSASVGVVSVSATTPSGQVMIGNTSLSLTPTPHFTGGGGVVEPAIDDANGNTVYLLTPTNAKTHPNAHNVAPLYLPVYPVGSGIDPSSLNCAHMPADNCPDHGPGVAGAAMGIVPSVYGPATPGGPGRVLGHDHLVGIASTGGDFNVIWEPVLVLFTSVDAAVAAGHITTLIQIRAAEAAGQAFEVPLPQLDFHCSAVSAAVFASGTPAPTVVGP